MNTCSESFVSPDASIVDAIRIIDSSSTQIALVVGENRRLLGIITDGDLRRSILRGVALDAKVTEIMNPSPITVGINDSKEKILSMMQLTNRRHMIVLDQSGNVVKIEYLNDLVQGRRYDNWVILMAGGFGKRLSPLTAECPKPLLKVGRKPILETIIENFIYHGFRRFYISVNYQADKLMDFFKDGSQWGAEIRYIQEKTELGTVGALSLIEELPEKSFIVMNGDILTKVNFQHLLDFHGEHSAHATMCIREYDFHIPYGVAKVDNHLLTDIREKPVQSLFVNAGIYVLEPQLINLIPKDARFDMTDLFRMVLDLKLNTVAFPIREYWLDIGKMNDFERANIEYERVFPENPCNGEDNIL